VSPANSLVITLVLLPLPPLHSRQQGGIEARIVHLKQKYDLCSCTIDLEKAFSLSCAGFFATSKMRLACIGAFNVTIMGIEAVLPQFLMFDNWTYRRYVWKNIW
jgi:hypothetical protein